MSDGKENDQAAMCPIYFGDHYYVGDTVMREWRLDGERRQVAGTDSELKLSNGAEPETSAVPDGLVDTEESVTMEEQAGAGEPAETEEPVGVEERAEMEQPAGATYQCMCEGPAVGPLNIIAAALPVDWTSCNWPEYCHGDGYDDDHNDDESYDSSDCSYSSEEDDRRRHLAGFVVIFSDSSDGSGSELSTEDFRSPARNRQPKRPKLKRKRNVRNQTRNAKNKRRKK